MTTSRTIARIALALAGAAVPALAGGCSAGAPSGESPGQTSEDIGILRSCANTPFTELTSSFKCTGGGGGGGSGGGIKVQSCFNTFSCDPVTAPPAYAIGAPYSSDDSLTGYATGSLVLAPSGPAGCTAGAVLRPNEPGLDHLADGTVRVDMWACQPGTPLPTSSVDGVAMCAVDPLDSLAAVPYMPAGETQCAWFYEGPVMLSDGDSAGTDCVGNADPGRTLLQERVFVAIKRGGIIGTSCPQGCTVPRELPPP